MYYSFDITSLIPAHISLHWAVPIHLILEAHFIKHSAPLFNSDRTAYLMAPNHSLPSCAISLFVTSISDSSLPIPCQVMTGLLHLIGFISSDITIENLECSKKKNYEKKNLQSHSLSIIL
jgi:hypothetical protein